MGASPGVRIALVSSKRPPGIEKLEQGFGRSLVDHDGMKMTGQELARLAGAAGGRTAQQKGTAHRFERGSEEASNAGKKGMYIRWSKYREQRMAAELAELEAIRQRAPNGDINKLDEATLATIEARTEENRKAARSASRQLAKASRIAKLAEFVRPVASLLGLTPPEPPPPAATPLPPPSARGAAAGVPPPPKGTENVMARLQAKARELEDMEAELGIGKKKR